MIRGSGRFFRRVAGPALLAAAAASWASGPPPGEAADAGAPRPPEAAVRVVPIPADPKARDAMTVRLPGTNDTVAMGATGLTNVPVGVLVMLEAGVVSPKDTPVERFVWTLTGPRASRARLSDPAAPRVTFTPDVVGVYKVDVAAVNKNGRGPLASVTLHAGTYIGLERGGCRTCHSEQAAEWAKTGHATILTRNLDEDPTKHYAEVCIGCHTTGYYLGAANGGFADLQAKTGWKFPAKVGIKGLFDAMPAELRALGNAQCEACHGPAREHALGRAKVMEASLEEGVCNVCHNGGGFHVKGEELKHAKHTEEASPTWTYASGPARQECVRCHSGAGYISFLKNPAEQAT